MVQINEAMFNSTTKLQQNTQVKSTQEDINIFGTNVTEDVSFDLGFQKTTSTKNPELENAPSPKFTVNGEEKNARIVVSLSENKLYLYDENGEAEEVHSVASGAKNTPTHVGLRKVSHIETYPYSSATGTKRKANPKPYGPKILILTSIDPKTGKNLGSNGEFIHGNSNASSIGKYVSHGCIRMHNDQILRMAEIVEPGSYVIIQK